MVERKVRVSSPDGSGKMLDGIDVPIAEGNEKWSEFTLEDGTVLRVKLTVASITRINDQYDAQGNPLYVASTAQAMAIVSVPEHLRKKVN